MKHRRAEDTCTSSRQPDTADSRGERERERKEEKAVEAFSRIQLMLIIIVTCSSVKRFFNAPVYIYMVYVYIEKIYFYINSA